MRAGRLLYLALLLPACGWAASWQFGPALPVTDTHGPHIFHHLESAGRKNIAVSRDKVAVAWEDNHSGTSQVYVALKPLDGGRFGPAKRLSDAGQAYEPSIAALPGNQFVVAWEEDGHVWARRVDAQGAGPRVKLGTGRQVSLVSRGERVYATWAADGPPPHIVLGRLHLGGQLTLRADAPTPVEPKLPPAPELYPSIALSPAGIVVAWEDRREGHTRLFTTFSAHGRQFTVPRPLNQLLKKRSEKFGRGTGVTRVTLATLPDGTVAAAWMDKRYFRNGYDIYAAFSRDGGRTFGHNQRVEDEFGDTYGQWHPAIAAGPHGTVAVVWDDNRDGTQDLWFSWSKGKGHWSTNASIPPAYGPGDQSNPALAFDAAGDLHVAWISQKTDYGPSRLLYAEGKPVH